MSDRLVIRREVALRTHLPAELADYAERLQEEEPELLAQAVGYALTRLVVAGHLRARHEEALGELCAGVRRFIEEEVRA